MSIGWSTPGKSLLLAALLGMVAALSGCGMATHVYQRTATVGNPSVPARSGAPLWAGDVRLNGEVNSVLLGGPYTATNSSGESPSLWVSRVEFGGAAYFGISDFFEMGVHGRYAPYGVTKANIDDAPSPPANARDGTKTLGMGLRVNVPVGEDDSGFVSILAELNFQTITHVEWETAYYEWQSRGTTDSYAGLTTVETSTVSQPKLSLQAGGTVLPALKLFGLTGLDTQHRNELTTKYQHTMDVIHDEPEPLEAYPVFIVGAGVEYRMEAFFATAIVFYPLHTETELEFGPALYSALGVTL